MSFPVEILDEWCKNNNLPEPEWATDHLSVVIDGTKYTLSDFGEYCTLQKYIDCMYIVVVAMTDTYSTYIIHIFNKHFTHTPTPHSTHMPQTHSYPIIPHTHTLTLLRARQATPPRHH